MLFIFFILGLIIGSFLNVVVYRLQIAESFLAERSHCPKCKKMIRWYDNIPVISFVLLGFRCRDCGEKISWQYPLMEIFTGLMFVLVGHYFFVLENVETWTTTIYHLGIVSFLLVIFLYDFLYMEIPSVVLWPAVGFAAAFNLFFDWSKIEVVGNILQSQVYSGVLAALAAFLFFFLMVAISKEKWMGLGDAQLAILMGIVLGWPQIILALMLAFSIGAIIGVLLVFLKRKKMGSQVPFAPFLIIGTFITLFFYNEIINWYWSWLKF
jgi:prepilin signal peptidase PulO-like enzyme (type II secretory pathway)